LVELARDGDQEAYELLVDHVTRPLFRVAHRILRDLDAAEDAVQRALVDIWRDLPRLKDLDRFDAWTYRLVVRASLDEARQRRRHAHIRELPPEGPSAPDASVALANRDALSRAFDRLKPDHRAVVVLHHYLGLPLAEIAMIMDVPYGTVGSRLHHALRELRGALSADATLPSLERVALPEGPGS
jgi:RNA polymerase sigma-70 factor (ECF subfamily)